MTAHTFHPRSHVVGLQPECPRCQELADSPGGLDSENRARILAGECHTELDDRAKQNLERMLRLQRQRDPIHRSRR